MRTSPLGPIAVGACLLLLGALPAAAGFVTFESGQVRPLALSPDGSRLFAVNTPDDRLEIFSVGSGSLTHLESVPVGLEPVALAERKSGELWVVNHLSDSISIVDVRVPAQAHVARTLLVGDEPRDIVFAGERRDRAFVTTAHRGQNTSRDPQLTTPGVGRADVWVFDAAHLGATLGGTPLTVITLFADTPRALAVTADGRTVYAAAFQSGNRTTAIHERVITFNGGLPPPFTDAQGVAAPLTSLVVKFRVDPADHQYHWLDNVGRRWDDHVKLGLPNREVFAIRKPHAANHGRHAIQSRRITASIDVATRRWQQHDRTTGSRCRRRRATVLATPVRETNTSDSQHVVVALPQNQGSLR